MPMNHVERFRAVMSFESADRLPVIEWAIWWDKTLDRWHAEGLPKRLHEAGEIRDYFGLDAYRQIWIRGARPGEDIPAPASNGAGILRSAAEYDILRPKMYPPDIVPVDLLNKYAAAASVGQLVFWLALDGFFWWPRVLFGIEQHMYAFYDRPELMHRMNQDLLAHHLRVIDEICANCKPEVIVFTEDMSYNHGSMLSKATFDEFLAPYYRQIVPVLKERGILPFVDSDGNVTAMLPWLENVGIEGLLPFERRSGVDVATIRENHPSFRMICAFDKTVMHKGETAMRQEFERLLPVMRKGGFIPAVDHQTPPNVSLTAYRVYVSLLKEYCERACVM